MDTITEYISKARSLGNTDDQIKQTLLNNGWQASIIEPYFTPIPPVMNEKVVSNNHFLTFFIIITICLIILGGILAGVIKYKNDSKFKSSLTNNQSPPSINTVQSTQKKLNDKSVFVAFVQNRISSSSAISSESEVKIYDLNKKIFIPSDPQILSLKDNLYTLGKWSPNGDYLPILTIRPFGEPEPLVFFNSVSKTSKIIYTFQENKESKYVSYSTSFWMNNRWIDDSHLIFYLEDLTKPSRKEFIINTNGVISEQTRAKDYIIQNAALKMTEDVSSESAILKALLIDGMMFTGSIKGKVIGLINDDVLSLESPYIPNIQDFSQDSKLAKKMSETKSESEITNILDEAMKPKGSWIIHLYNKKSGLETKIHEIVNEGWAVKDIQIRPKNKTILIALQEKATPPFAIRFIELNTSNLTYRTVGQTSKIISFPGFSLSNLGEYFNVSSDGNWLVSYDDVVTETKSGISAWNLNSGEKNVICETSCSEIRVYNPETLTPR